MGRGEGRRIGFTHVVLIQQVLGVVEIAVCLMVFGFLAAKGKWRDYWALGAFLLVRAASNGGLLLVRHSAGRLGNSTAYKVYFYVYWLSFAVESTLVILILYGLVRLMMAPLKGLQIVARLVFCVTALASVTASLCSGGRFTPKAAIGLYKHPQRGGTSPVNQRPTLHLARPVLRLSSPTFVL